MPAAHDLEPPSIDERERLEKKRGDAAFAFEMDHPPYKRSRLDHFGQGVTDHMPKMPNPWYGGGKKAILPD